MHVAPLFNELKIVNEHWHESQHWSRRWEYAMALKAVRTWETDRQAHVAVDVGGAGSPFHSMLSDELGCHVDLVDPAYAPRPRSLEEHVQRHPNLADIVTCISVIEHVEDLETFCYHLATLVAPGGLLFLTCDYWNLYAPDTAHFHWMRKRIFNRGSLYKVIHGFRDFHMLGDQPWGTFDDTWHGPIENWGYAPASLALVKRA